MSKPYIPRESRLVSEWLAEVHPRALQWKKARVGPLPTGQKEAIFGILRRYPDIVFVENDTVFIVEAKMTPEPGALGQLELYEDLFPDTPEFHQIKAFPHKLIFLTTFIDPAVARMCAEKGIDYIVYAPDWVQEYHAERVV